MPERSGEEVPATEQAIEAPHASCPGVRALLSEPTRFRDAAWRQRRAVGLHTRQCPGRPQLNRSDSAVGVESNSTLRPKTLREDDPVLVRAANLGGPPRPRSGPGPVSAGELQGL
uniref:Uncharacterized protein n=1 Tax=Rangifer tarandus platyrhynchus TaxID=3082113 RepID=A0ACB0F334_RANTA|nr:unnamed protein product [Rangifer tarandus platyrhynchus]